VGLLMILYSSACHSNSEIASALAGQDIGCIRDVQWISRDREGPLLSSLKNMLY
jgi:hypothetical protein